MLIGFEDGDGMIIMTNGDNGGELQLTWEVVRTVAYEYGWADFQPEDRAPVAPSAPSFDKE